MAVDSPTSVMDSLLEKLKLDDPWVIPRSWDSIPCQPVASSKPPSDCPPARYSSSVVSEPSLVRLAMNALQGVESALISIEKLSAVLCYGSADRTSHQIPSLWVRCSSTAALGNLLTSIGQFGCLVFLLHRFVKHFMAPDVFLAKEPKENPKTNSLDEGKFPESNLTLINQAFAISVGKVMDGYLSALNTLSASASLRRFSNTNEGGCLSCIGHSEVTLLEVYLHTMGLRTQIEALGNICNVNHQIVGFPLSSFEAMKTKADTEFNTFPRGGALLSFLYAQLKIADPDNCALLKFLFIRSYEPYCNFIRTWIFDGSISDPYHEFIVECTNYYSTHATMSNTGIAAYSPLPTIRVRDTGVLPCFLEECIVPLCRTGQQLQVIIKFLELSNNVGPYDTHEEVLPSLVGLSSEHPWFEIPLTFEKEAIETMVHVRSNYYCQMLEKVESIVTKFDFSEQVASQSVPLSLLNNHRKNPNHKGCSADQSVISTPMHKRNQYVNSTTVDDDLLSTVDEYSYTEDLLELSECSSSEGYEEQNEVEKMNFVSQCDRPSYLSALDISSTISTDEIPPVNLTRNATCSVYQSQKETHSLLSGKKYSETPQTWAIDDTCPSGGCDIDVDEIDTNLCPSDHQLKSMGDFSWLKTEIGLAEVANKDKLLHLRDVSSKAFSFHVSKLRYDSAFFCMNPSLNRGSLFNLRAIIGERARANYMSSYFDFTSVKDPLEACGAKLAGDHGPELVSDRQVMAEIPVPVAGIDAGNHADVGMSNDVIVENTATSCDVSLPLHKEGGHEERLLLPNISGGSAWESLLGRSGNIVDICAQSCQRKFVGGADMPLDFVIKKCVMDEILLQYNYVSKLTIKLLIEGFKLQEHLQALRCYHFMEVADWADLFIMSLWHRKLHVSDVDKSIPEIQGVLELAVQRSSCEGDPHKERLYVYQKGDRIRDLSTSPMGIHYFDFLGLGYRVDWPVNIILTPAALGVYSEIFNFLIQIKLAVSSLSDAWCSLKGYHLEQHKGEANHLSVLTETRHKLIHFVSTLQQYVQSQLSQVSWYRFLQSLKHKVKDMFDLESVHMAYLAESLHICFLSNETQSIAGIIQSILQCAIDFRSCLNGCLMLGGSNSEELADRFSLIDIMQVQSIRKAFAKSVEELYLIYLQSPKHGEFGLSRFWDYLNYNEYYAGVMSKKMGHCIFY